LRVLPESTVQGYYYFCIGCAANTAEELGGRINYILNDINGLNVQAELVDVKYEVSNPREGVLIFSAQIIFRSKQKIEI
jgi:hypothetical protein